MNERINPHVKSSWQYRAFGPFLVLRVEPATEHVSHSGNKRLKRAMLVSALTPILFDLTKRSWCDRKLAQGKPRRNQALIALADRRLAVLFGMIRIGLRYDVPELEVA